MKSGIRIRIRQTENLAEITDLDNEIFKTEVKLTEAELGDSIWWIATENDYPVGFAGIMLMPAENKALMTRAGVIESARGRGLQKRMIRVRVQYARRQGYPRVYTYVWAGNFASLTSLMRCGFRPYHIERKGENPSYIYLENKAKAC